MRMQVHLSSLATLVGRNASFHWSWEEISLFSFLAHLLLPTLPILLAPYSFLCQYFKLSLYFCWISTHLCPLVLKPLMMDNFTLAVSGIRLQELVEKSSTNALLAFLWGWHCFCLMREIWRKAEWLGYWFVFHFRKCKARALIQSYDWLHERSWRQGMKDESHVRRWDDVWFSFSIWLSIPKSLSSGYFFEFGDILWIEGIRHWKPFTLPRLCVLRLHQNINSTIFTI